MKALAAFLARHPWIYVVLAFAILIGAWSVFIVLAHQHAPEQIEVPRERQKNS